MTFSPRRHGLMFVLSSPSGAGKTTLSRRLLAANADVELSVSVTTRPPRPGEVHGQHYHFISEHDYQTLVAQHALLEHASVFDHHYGTPASFVQTRLAEGKDVLFDIDWQGMEQLRRLHPHDVVSVFILPPSLAELERRLRSRAQDSDETVARRMKKAAAEISHWQEYDYVLLNDDLDHTSGQVMHILHAERLKRTRQRFLNDFIAALS